MSECKTPNTSCSYLPSSAYCNSGKTGHFYGLPVRIKVTPKNVPGPLSEGKKEKFKCLQPVLVKDLFPSTKKDNRRTTAVLSASTVKKKQPENVVESFLNTQSCGRSKRNNEQTSSFLNRKSQWGSNVRRQLYQDPLDCSRVLDSSKDNAENSIIGEKIKKNAVKLTSQPLNVIKPSNSRPSNAYRKSLLVPPNSVKEYHLQKNKVTGRSIKPNAKTTDAIKIRSFAKPKSVDEKKRVNDYASLNKSRETFIISKKVNTQPDNAENSNFVERPTVIVSPSKQKMLTHNNTVDISTIKNHFSSLNRIVIAKNDRDEIFKSKLCSLQNTLKQLSLDHSAIQENDISDTGFLNIKSFFHESILPHMESLIYSCEIFNAFIHDYIERNKKTGNELISNTENTIENVSPKGELETTKVIENFKSNVLEKTFEECMCDEKVESEKNLPIKIFQEEEQQSLEESDLTVNLLAEINRLSTIGEVSCEFEELYKEEREKQKRISEVNQPIVEESHIIPKPVDFTDCLENETKKISNLNVVNATIVCPFETQDISPKETEGNKENVEYSTLSPNILKSFRTPKKLRTPKTPSSDRRRSLRIAALKAKSKSEHCLSIKSFLSEAEESGGDTDDSFVALEKTLNVQREMDAKFITPLPPMNTKSLPASPGFLKPWDKNIEQPLREYMALKSNGNFLVTPDVKKFQSLNLETTDTPHSRKSLSRKIFMELCDLYAESPEHK